MGSKARKEAIANGRIVESSASVRRRRRQEAAIAREELAIEMCAQGSTNTQISEELFKRWGVKLTSAIPELIRRGLYRRVHANKENVDIAKAMLREYYIKMLEKWMPLALGTLTDPDTGLQARPDARAADVALRVLRDWATVEGALAPARSGDINLNILNGVHLDNEESRNRALDSLRAESEKQRTIEGRLADTPARPDVVEDGKTPPPFLGPARPPGE